MTGRKSKLLFTLRGHQCGIEALTTVGQTLISGDTKGNLIFWSLNTFRQIRCLEVCKSKIQSLKTIKLTINAEAKDIIVCQTREDGVKLVIHDAEAPDAKLSDLIPLEFPTDVSYSRGDALSLNVNSAILAYPGCARANHPDNSRVPHKAKVHYLGPDAKILASGDVTRASEGGLSAPMVFDLRLVRGEPDSSCHYLFTAYEDGTIVISAVDLERVKGNELGREDELEIAAVRKLDLGLKDFITTFDVGLISPNNYVIVCGSMQTKLIFCLMPTNFQKETIRETDLETRGLDMMNEEKIGSYAISIRDDLALVAVSKRDYIILFSLKSLSIIARDHTFTRVNSIICTKKQRETDRRSKKYYGHMMLCAGNDGTIVVYEME